MIKGNIMNTETTYFRFKTTKYNNYSIGEEENKRPYILGEGKKETSLITVADDTILYPLLDLKESFADLAYYYAHSMQREFLLKELKQKNNSKENIKYINNQLEIIEDVLEGNTIKIENLYIVILSGFLNFFEKYGIPTNFSKDTEGKVSYPFMAKKLEDLFLFCEDLEELNNSYQNIEVPLSQIGVIKNKDNTFEIINYFNCPFEYTKFNLLLKAIINGQRTIHCEFCNSLIISRRSNQRFCSNSCRAKASRERKKNKERS